MKIIILFIILSTSIPIVSQNTSEEFLGSWYTYQSNHRLNDRFSLSPYGELRFYEPSSNYNLAFVSLRGNYHFKSNQTLGFGYAYLDIDTVFEFDKKPNVHENRFFEQYTYNHKLGRINVSHRVRLEQRLLNFRARNELQNRFRYCLTLRYDINKTFYALLREEPFVNFQNQVFHENRLYIGVGIHIMKNSELHIGYLKQNIRDNNLNRIQIGISLKTDHRKNDNSKVSL